MKCKVKNCPNETNSIMLISGPLCTRCRIILHDLLEQTYEAFYNGEYIPEYVNQIKELENDE